MVSILCKFHQRPQYGDETDRNSNYMIESLDSREEQLGSDAAGYVAAVGPNVHHVKPGDRVAVFLPGAYSTRVRVHQYCLSKIPQSMSMEDAATLPSLLLSAYQIVIQSCRLNCRDSILVASAESCEFLLLKFEIDTTDY